MWPASGKKTLSGFESRTSWPAASIVVCCPFVAMGGRIVPHSTERSRMETLNTMTYERDGRVAWITLDRPERGNGITLEMPRELSACVERANLDPQVHVLALAGNGSGFCGGYDLVASAEAMSGGVRGRPGARRARRSTRPSRRPTTTRIASGTR